MAAPTPKSPRLAQQIQLAFGDKPIEDPSLLKLIQQVDDTYRRLGNLQQAANHYGRVSAVEWNFVSGQIEGGSSWKTQLGYPSDELENRISVWQGLVAAEDLKALIQAVNEHAKSGSAQFQQDCRMRTKSGLWRWMRVSGQISARMENGQPRRALVVVSDIDETKRSEAAMLQAKDAAEAASRTRSAFLANMSHEIRTPMNAVLGMTELALGTQLDTEQRHYLGIVKSSAEALLTIINDILDFSKIEAGKLQFERVDFAPRTLVFDAIRAVALHAQEKGLEVLVSVAKDVPMRLLGDPTRLRQVLTNLVSNAIKFTETGEIAVEVSLDGRSADSAALRFCVRDTGMGIAPDKQEAIFEAFAQADQSISRRFGGTGLGLAICSRLVDMMGGRIWVESEPGKGSRFLFTSHFGINTDAVPETPKPPRFAGKRALVAIANGNLAETTGSMLSEYGFATTVCHKADESLTAIINGGKYDLLVADGPLLIENDAALVTAWQSSQDKNPLIALHALPTHQTASARLRALGVECHVVKPVSSDELLDAIDLAWGNTGNSAFALDEFTVDQSLVAAMSPSSSLEILLVEDNLINQELAVRLLQRGGHHVTVANHGEEALELFDKGHYDVIFMDMQMPVMGGIEATEAIRAREMRRSWVLSVDHSHMAYIIAMTANAMAGDRERCLDAGMNDYVAKPIQVAELNAALARACTELGKPLPQNAPQPASRGQVADVPAIDIAATERDLGDRALVMDLAKKLLDQWDRLIEMLDASFAARDADALLRDSHTIKGLLAMFHAESARKMALDLERASRAKNWDQAEFHLGDLKVELDRIKPLLTKAVKSI